MVCVSLGANVVADAVKEIEALRAELTATKAPKKKRKAA